MSKHKPRQKDKRRLYENICCASGLISSIIFVIMAISIAIFVDHVSTRSVVILSSFGVFSFLLLACGLGPLMYRATEMKFFIMRYQVLRQQEEMFNDIINTLNEIR